ncbi:DedA family protein [Bacillus cereus]|uniref:DedA family protein n=1 Tax=Bacillus thuringiensis TaxID=1428 RepID=A0A9X6ZNU1_BACTU|nr:DedA family protein [Bacillus thuringiensis]PFJ24674.1 DedA family protein [Bacillus thuringiensis]
MKDFIMHVLMFLSDLGYLGIALGLMIEVIPSEIVLSYGGFLVAQGKITFIGAVIAGSIGGLFAQLFLYWIGLYGGRAFIYKFGKYIFIQKKHVDLAEKWFQKYGSAVVFFARFIPVVRHAISIPAGLSKMPLNKFIGYTSIAMVPWTILFLSLGVKLNDNWEQINTIAEPYVKPVMFTSITLIVMYLAFVIIKKKFILKKENR